MSTLDAVVGMSLVTYLRGSFFSFLLMNDSVTTYLLIAHFPQSMKYLPTINSPDIVSAKGFIN